MPETDWAELIRQVDKSGMWNLLLSVPEDLRRAYEIADRLEIPERLKLGEISIKYGEPSNVVIAGMGGSAIGGDLAREYFYDRAQIPIRVVRWFKAPGYAGENTLAVVSSYSGKTEETISAMEELIAKRCMVVLITSDGFLEEYAEKTGLPIVKIPKGRPPRTAIAYLYTSLLVVLDKFGVKGFDKREFEEAVEVLEEMRRELLEEGSAALQARGLARKIMGKIPLIYSYPPYYSVAFRFKTQLNENAKIHAFSAQIPEMFHNEIMGWEGVQTANFYSIILRGREESERLEIRIDFLKEVLESVEVPYEEVWGRGEGRLANQLSLLYIADMTSYFLALLRGIDPTPVAMISKLKKRIGDKYSTK